KMKRFLKLLILIIIPILLATFVNLEAKAILKKEVKKMKKTVVIVIASKNFRDKELFDTKKSLDKGGINTVIASSTLNKVTGVEGNTVQPDILLKDVNMDKYDAIAFIGGIGSKEYWDDPTAHKVAKQAYDNGKIVAAICMAPVTLAKAGLLNGKKFNVWESEVETIKNLGGRYYPEPVVVDGKIVTGPNADAALAFGQKIAEMLK
ncbi:MAG: DJ-1/PfpI family protein, partial [Proteobacteria bacterium]|nr:DJ-1/PfpI family protein [Pseudomonadota bacterium]